MNIKWFIVNRLREYQNKYLASYRRKRILKGRENFTIISNTCWAGHVYRYFGLPYNTPTIGVGFFADEYIKFVSNLHYYLSLPLEEMKPEESKYFKLIQKQPAKFQSCPYARLGDIELRFAHYKTFADAKSNWDRRCKRVNFDNLIVKFSEHMGCEHRHLIAFDKLPFERKFVFVTRNYGLKSQVIFKDFIYTGDVKDDTLHFNKHVDLIKLVNGENFKLNQ